MHLDAVIASRALKQYAPQAKALSEQLKTDLPKNKDMSLLSDINSLTSGTQYSRKLGASIGTPAYTEAMKNTQALNPFLNATKKITQNTWGDNRFDALYTKEKFDGFTSRTSAPSENFIGMVDYEQTL